MLKNFKFGLGRGRRSISNCRYPKWAAAFRRRWRIFSPPSARVSRCCAFAGLVNGYVLKKRVGSELLGGIMLINLVVFGVCFAIMAVFTFLPPMVMTGLIFVLIALAVVLQRLNPGSAKQKPAG